MKYSIYLNYNVSQAYRTLSTTQWVVVSRLLDILYSQFNISNTYYHMIFEWILSVVINFFLSRSTNVDRPWYWQVRVVSTNLLIERRWTEKKHRNYFFVYEQWFLDWIKKLEIPLINHPKQNKNKKQKKNKQITLT